MHEAIGEIPASSMDRALASVSELQRKSAGSAVSEADVKRNERGFTPWESNPERKRSQARRRLKTRADCARKTATRM